MGRLGKIKDSFSGISFVVIAILIVFVIVNIAHLIWYIVKPEGFWSFFSWLRTFILVIGGLAVLLMLLWLIMIGVMDLFNNFSFKKLLLGIGFIALLLVMQGLNFFQINYLELKFYKLMADKYKYLEQSEELVRNAQFEEALSYAKKAKKNAVFGNSPWPIFVLTKYYQNTEDGRLAKLDEQYAVSINYAYCLSNFDSLKNESIQEYNNILHLTDTALLSKRKDYKVYPLTALIDLYLKYRKFEKADSCNIELMSFIEYADKADTRYFIECQEEVAEYALKSGDEKTYATLHINNLDIYRKAKLSKKSSQYLYHLISAAWGHLLLKNTQAAGKLLIEAIPFAEKKSKSEFYITYLMTKAKYCEMVSVSNTGNKNVIKKGWWQSFLSFFSPSLSDREQFISASLDCYEGIIEKIEKRYGNNSLEYEHARYQLGYCYLKFGNYAGAEQIFHDITARLNSYKQVPVDFKNRIYIVSLFCQLMQRRNISDLTTLKDITASVFNEAVNKLIYLNEYERDVYADQIQQQLEIINAILVRINTPAANMQLYNNILASKNLVLYTNRYQRRLLHDSLLKTQYLQLLQEKDVNANQIDVLLKEKNFLHSLRSRPDFKSYDPLEITWQDVKNGLAVGDVAVEYFPSYNLSDSSRSNDYYALILQADFSYPKLVRICKEQDLNKLINDRENLIAQINITYVHSIALMRKLLIAPITENTMQSGHLFISPSGILHQVSFPALLEESGLTYDIVGSTRILKESNSMTSLNGSVILFGGIDYGSQRSQHNNSVKRRFNRLVATLGEVKDIDKLLAGHEVSSEAITDGNATEKKFRSLSGGHYDVIHVASHGYYDKGQEVVSVDVTSDRLNVFQSITAMRNCNLVFAGANNMHADKLNDGILSAQDIEKMDLSGTKLVVLSACETGLGKIYGFEGVQGFQRAFSLAGVDEVLVTLWNISDKHTAEMMRYFYERIVKGEAASRALIGAQEKMKRLYRNPYYWAGFVLIKS
ncbi:CHAT domain-containing protein [Chitinophaga filiformis]|uniref:CHAT domain-containing protein n=1 Tax=Chitinophaga filiformis TaxID=104663 RepID=A0A1G7TPR2_CHIFI|nr:CHAT domain-containing protein [Chitinophaga filiformis]SDG36964.1 CHAT domain-containing protein [Chitinophaga filiformis]